MVEDWAVDSREATEELQPSMSDLNKFERTIKRTVTPTQEPHYGDTGGCECQFYGKSAVPWPSGKCMICGYKVNPNGPHTQ